jgi:hypothetical protein
VEGVEYNRWERPRDKSAEVVLVVKNLKCVDRIS